MILLSAILLLAAVSAVNPIDLTVTSTTTGTSFAPGATVSGNLTISNINADNNFTSMSISGSSITFGSLSQLNAETSATITFSSLVVPAGTTQGNNSFPFTITGTRSDLTTFTYNGNIIVNVSSYPHFTISSPSTLTRSSNSTTIILSNDGNVALNINSIISSV